MNSNDISILSDNELLSRIVVTREQISLLSALKFELLEEARNRVDSGGGVIVTDDHVAIISPPLEIQMIDIKSIRNQFSDEELAARNLLLVKNRRAAVRISPNLSLCDEEENT